MRPLSASEAISPAIERTKDLLVRPFRLSTFFKLAAVAAIAEIGGGGGFGAPGRTGHLPATTPAINSAVLALVFGFSVVFLIVAIILFYVGSRLQLVLVELVATRNTRIAPLWRRFGPATWRWLGFRLLFVIVSIVVFVSVAGPFLVNLFTHPPVPGAPLPPGFLAHVFSLVAILFPVFFLLVVFYILLRDFALPSIVFENLSIGGALDRIRALLTAEPGQIALYVLLRTLLGFAMVLVAEFACGIAILLSLIPLGLIGAGIWFATRNSGPSGTAILLASASVGALILVVWTFSLAIAAVGPVFLFLQSYALYFLGGRYPLLGNLLEPPLIPGPLPPPQAFYPNPLAPGFPPIPTS